MLLFCVLSITSTITTTITITSTSTIASTIASTITSTITITIVLLKKISCTNITIKEKTYYLLQLLLPHYLP